MIKIIICSVLIIAGITNAASINTNTQPSSDQVKNVTSHEQVTPNGRSSQAGIQNHAVLDPNSSKPEMTDHNINLFDKPMISSIIQVPSFPNRKTGTSRFKFGPDSSLKYGENVFAAKK